MSIKIGQVGVGHLGERHCAALQQINDTELVGIFDINQEKCKKVSSQYKTRAFNSLSSLINEVDALVVAVPTRHHHEIVKKALEEDRHVFVEKPITAYVHEAEQLVELAEKRQVILQVGHVERFNPAILALSGQKLAPMFIEAHRLSTFDPRGTDVAVVLDLMIHDLDLILHLVESPLVKIDASGVAVISSEIDIANARLQFANGCVANVTASRISLKKMRKMRLFQKDAYIGVDFLNRSTEVFRLVNPSEIHDMDPSLIMDQFSTFSGKNILHQKFTNQDSQINPLKLELEAFVKSIQTGQPPLVDGKVAMEVLRVANKIIQIIEGQKTHLQS